MFQGLELKKKLGPKYGVKKAGCENQGHCYSKIEEATVTNRLVFSKQE
jgi:hypothetical protein